MKSFFSARLGCSFRVSSILIASLLLTTPTLLAQSEAQHYWKSVGPDGGDARSFAVDPKNPSHLYLGTTSSWIYQTEDAGKSWQRLALLGGSNDLVIKKMFVDRDDPKTLVVGAYQIDSTGGGIYMSHDDGHTWSEVPDMAGQSVRSLAQAPSNPKVYIAGTIKGVYRSNDGGQHWTQISTPEAAELHEVESVAIDPDDTNTIYAGTWHLPWKTTDGGAHWSNITTGLIDDSDVFSIIIDPKAPTVVYASACSGIYKSDSAGNLFHKVQGIPSTARRTRVLMQDPANRDIVYAGTTEGLYKTSDAGQNWVRLTGPDVIINDVYVDPSNDQHVLLATDRSGVLASTDGAKTFTGSNNGFSQRQVETLLVDHKQPGTLYAGVLNDKIYGGVFVSHDEGASWQQQADGLNGRDVFAMAQSPDGAVYAGTNNGVVKLSGSQWQADGSIVEHTSHTVTERVHGRRVHRTVTTEKKNGQIDGRVNALSLPAGAWFASTVTAVYRSDDSGASWQSTSLPTGDYRFVSASGDHAVAATRSSIMASNDSGHTWQAVPLPSSLHGVNALIVTPDNAIWVGGLGGVFYTKDGTNWQQIEHLPLGDIDGLDYDPEIQRVIVSSRNGTTIFAVDANGSKWKYWQPGWRLHQVLQQGDHLVAASLFDGVVIEPKSGEGH